MSKFVASTHCIKATRNRFVILDSLIMVCGICWSLYLVLSLTGLTHQSQSRETMLTSLKNLVIDNSRSTVTFNSTMLRKLFASSANRPGMQMHEKSVSFSVNVKAKELKLRAGQTVIYDGVLTNEGNGYDDRTGVFTCPVAGTYIFVVDALSPKPVWLHLYLNKKIVASLHVHGSHGSGAYVQISRTVVLTLKKGDHVKVVNDVSYTGAVYHRDFSGFSGARLS